MTRVPLPTDDELTPEVKNVLDNIPPLNVFRAVGRLPESFTPFMQLGGSLLGDPGISTPTREIAILRVAHITGAGYEWAQHEQIARNVGVSDEAIAALQTDDPSDSGALDADGALAARVAEEISRDVRLSDQALDALIERYGNKGAASMVLCVSYYNMVSRFLESMRVEIEDEQLLHGQTPGETSEK
jgi:4-carboxymuconolactone decarboxylase